MTTHRLKDKKIVIGIDPGTKRIGLGVIEIHKKNLKLVDAGLLKPKTEKISAPAQALASLINKYHPNLLCIEKVYFSKNIRSAISVSEVKGALMSEAEKQNLEIVEISPTEVKNTLTGYGQADKTSVRKMVFGLLGEQKGLKSKDAIDALAIAIAGEIKNRAEKLVET